MAGIIRNLTCFNMTKHYKNNILPFSSSLAKNAARQSCKVTVGPQNQLGTHETTNLKYH